MTTVEVLTPWIERVVMEVLEADHLHRDPDGDIPITLDRTILNLRLGEGPNGIPRLHLFSPLLKDIEATPTLYGKLNEVNRDAAYLRFALEDGVIWASMDVVAESFRPEDLANGLAATNVYSETIGTLLGLPEAKPWRDVQPSKDEEATPSEPSSDGSTKLERDLASSPGPAAHVTVPSRILPDDPSPADGALSLRMGYL